MNESVDILLATYNGEKYLEQQITSIVNQEFSNWSLIIRDDGSSDKTLQVLSKFIQLYPDKIQLLDDGLGQLGPSASFNQLLHSSSASYLAFCDQDDIWLPEKLSRLMQSLLRAEILHGVDSPLLVHSDLEVINHNAEKIADSFWAYQKLNPSKMQTLEKLLVQNTVTGCATMINQALLNIALPIPRNAIMHDWWLSLLAASSGKIETVDTVLVRYRQHDKNDTGAKKWSIGFVLTGVATGRKKYKASIEKTRKQAHALLDSGRLDAEKTEIVSQYVKLFECNWFSRRMIMFRMGFYKYGFIRNMAFMLWM